MQSHTWNALSSSRPSGSLPDSAPHPGTGSQQPLATRRCPSLSHTPPPSSPAKAPWLPLYAEPDKGLAGQEKAIPGQSCVGRKCSKTTLWWEVGTGHRAARWDKTPLVDPVKETSRSCTSHACQQAVCGSPDHTAQAPAYPPIRETCLGQERPNRLPPTAHSTDERGFTGILF